MYGDAVLDTEQGFAILSGDQLIVRLAIELGAERVIFGSDVDGIFTSNPKLDKNAELIHSVSLSNNTADVGDTTFTDVTGGMMGKLTEAEEAVKAGTSVIFLNALASNRVESALRGEKVMGTVLTL
jgi:isopentenyl phosphate kinase